MIFESYEYQLTYVQHNMIDTSIGFIACLMFICTYHVHMSPKLTLTMWYLPT